MMRTVRYIVMLCLSGVLLVSCAKSADKDKIDKDVDALRNDRIATLQMQKDAVASGLDLLRQIEGAASASSYLSKFLDDSFGKDADWQQTTLATLEAHDSTVAAVYALHLGEEAAALRSAYLRNANGWVNYRFDAVSRLLVARGRLEAVTIPASYTAVLAQKDNLRSNLNGTIKEVATQYAVIASDAIELERGVLTTELLQRIDASGVLADTAIESSDAFIRQFGSLPAAGVIVSRQATDIAVTSARLNGILNIAEEDWTSVKFGFKFGQSGTSSDLWTTRWIQEKDATGWYVMDLDNLSIETSYSFQAVAVVDRLSFEGEVLSFTTLAVDVAMDGGVDMGVSVKWASCNLGASRPDVSMYSSEIKHYCWGETGAKTIGFTASEYEFGWPPAKYNSEDGLTQLELTDDVAHSILGGKWRIPTEQEFQELIDSCDAAKTTLNGVSGLLFTSRSTSNSIFLPGTGFRDVTSWGLGMCFYWTSSRSAASEADAYSFESSGNTIYRNTRLRWHGLAIRPVTE